jgi:thioredoxin 1
MTFSFILKGIIFVSLCLTWVACEDDSMPDAMDDSTNALVSITSLQDFQVKSEEGISLFFFHATWCSICADQRPAIEALPEEDELKEMFFGEVDYEQVQEVVTATGVQGFPTIVIFKDGEEQERLTGAGHSVDKLKNLLLEL